MTSYCTSKVRPQLNPNNNGVRLLSMLTAPLRRRAGCTGCQGYGTPIASSRRCDLEIGANVTIPRARHHRGPRGCTSIPRNVFFAFIAPRRAYALLKYRYRKNQPTVTLPPHICFRAASKRRQRKASGGFRRDSVCSRTEPATGAHFLRYSPVSHSVALPPSPVAISSTASTLEPERPWVANRCYCESSVFFSPVCSSTHAVEGKWTRAFGAYNVHSHNVSAVQ